MTRVAKCIVIREKAEVLASASATSWAAYSSFLLVYIYTITTGRKSSGWVAYRLAARRLDLPDYTKLRIVYGAGVISLKRYGVFKTKSHM